MEYFFFLFVLFEVQDRMSVLNVSLSLPTNANEKCCFHINVRHVSGFQVSHSEVQFLFFCACHGLLFW